VLLLFIAPLLGGMLTKIIDAPINRRLRKKQKLEQEQFRTKWKERGLEPQLDYMGNVRDPDVIIDDTIIDLDDFE
jgi:hypothetical protein